MKKSLIFIFGLALLMAGCKAHLPVAQQGGMVKTMLLICYSLVRMNMAGNRFKCLLTVQRLSLQKLLKPRKPVAKGHSMLSLLVPET